jgi:hypothetical protein
LIKRKKTGKYAGPFDFIKNKTEAISRKYKKTARNPGGFLTPHFNLTKKQSLIGGRINPSLTSM